MKQFSAMLIGDEPILVECGRLLLEHGHTIVAVATDSPDIGTWAEEVATHIAPDLKDPGSPLWTADYDYLFSIGNLRIIPAEMLDHPKIAAINFHDGILPTKSGLYTTSWTIIEGLGEHGVTWHEMDTYADVGPVLRQIRFPLDAAETAYSLDTKCFDAGVRAFRELVVDIEQGTVVRTPQDDEQRGQYGRYKRPVNFAVIDGRTAAKDIDQLVRALFFGRRANPLVAPKLLSEQGWVAVTETSIEESASLEPGGTILAVDDSRLKLSTQSEDIWLGGLMERGGQALSANRALALLGLTKGEQLPEFPLPSVLDSNREAIARVEPVWEQAVPLANPLAFPGHPSPGAASADWQQDVNGALAQVMPGDCRRELIAAACWLAFVARATGATDFSVGFRTAGVAGVMQEGLSPELLNSLYPLNVSVDTGRSLDDFVAAMEGTLGEAARLSPCFSDLALRRPGWHRATRELFGQPFPIGLIHEDIAGSNSSLDLPGELTLRVKSGGEVCIEALHDNGKDHAAWIAGLYVTFLRSAAVASHEAVGKLQLVSEHNWVRLRDEWNATAFGYEPASGVLGHIAFDSDRVAVQCGDTCLTYKELQERCERLAAGLRNAGVSRGSIVGIFMDRSADLLCTMLAIWRAGATYLPLDPAFPADRLQYMLTDSGAQHVVTDESDSAALNLEGLRAVTVDQMLEAGAGGRAETRENISEDLAYLLYTSGSTGKPKGVMVPHRAVVNFLLTMAESPGIRTTDILVAVTTTSFDISVLELYLPLIGGGTVVIAGKEDSAEGARLKALLERSNATLMQATPSTWRLLIDADWQGSGSFRALCGGEPFPQDLAGELLTRCGEVWNMYGPTETTVWSTCKQLRSEDPRISIGRPIGNTQVYVLNDWGSPQPPHVPGELCIGGDGVAHGYLNRIELTADRFVPDPYAGGDRMMYRTGDLAQWLDYGELEHLGRMDSQVKVRGFRIELGEIESVLADHETVARAAVSVWAPDIDDQRLVAYLVTHPGSSLAPVQLRKHLRGKLPDYMVPQHFVSIDALPTTPNGKIDRKQLPAPRIGGDATATSPPETDVERNIAAIWCSVLGIESVGRHDNFFDLGGHSLLAVKAASEWEKTHGSHIELRQFVMNSLAQIAASVEASAGGSATAGEGQEKPGLLQRLFGQARSGQ